MDPVNISFKFAVRSFTRSWDNRDCSFGLELRTPSLGDRKGRGKYCHLPLLCSSTPLFPTLL